MDSLVIRAKGREANIISGVSDRMPRMHRTRGGGGGGQKQSNDPGNNQHILNTPIIGRR